MGRFPRLTPVHRVQPSPIPGASDIKSKWVFKLKADGRYRTRLVAKGFTQIPGIDYDETFSPVAHFELLWLLLVLAALEDWEIQQMDIKSAFLNGVLDEEIYMEQPIGFITPRTETKVCCLKRAIYGLKQASHTWNIQFHGFLLTTSTPCTIHTILSTQNVTSTWDWAWLRLVDRGKFWEPAHW